MCQEQRSVLEICALTQFRAESHTLATLLNGNNPEIHNRKADVVAALAKFWFNVTDYHICCKMTSNPVFR